MLFNNAGIMPAASTNALKTKERDDMIDINIKGVLNGIAAALLLMEAQGSGAYHQHGVDWRRMPWARSSPSTARPVRGAHDHGRAAQRWTRSASPLICAGRHHDRAGFGHHRAAGFAAGFLKELRKRH